MSIYVVNAGQFEVFADRAALKAAVEKAVKEERNDYDGVEVIEGAALAFSVETEPRVTIGDPVAVKGKDRKPRAPKWTPDPKVAAAILDWFAPGVEATVRKFCDETGMASDTATKHVKHLVEEGTMTKNGPDGKTYRAAVPAGKVAT